MSGIVCLWRDARWSDVGVGSNVRLEGRTWHVDRIERRRYRMSGTRVVAYLLGLDGDDAGRWQVLGPIAELTPVEVAIDPLDPIVSERRWAS